MKNNLQIVALSVALFSPSLNAASLASGDVLITVTSSGGTAATSDNSANAYVGVSADLINNKGDVGDASASGNALTIINDSGGFTADLVLTPATAAAVVRDQNAGNPVADASASVSYSATFTLAPTESGVFSLDLNYSLTEGGAEAFFTWSLSGTLRLHQCHQWRCRIRYGRVRNPAQPAVQPVGCPQRSRQLHSHRFRRRCRCEHCVD